jgi:hypothetical protein
MSKKTDKTKARSEYLSLLPYLNPQPQGSIYLKLSINPKAIQKNCPACVPCEQAGPTADLLKAAVCLGASKEIMDLFLLVQTDEPRVSTSELEALTNIDIEQLWQETLSKHAQPLFSLCAQDKQGHWSACQPLFMCRYKGVFFHPLCPACGKDLSLCQDDALLKKNSLPEFSKSLMRYLYCEACSQEKPVFYVKSINAEPRPEVQDASSLIEQFSRLLPKSKLKDKLPCIGCASSKDCFGPDNLFFKRLAAVRFYPFHLVLQRAPTLNALDFLALLAGAESGKIEACLNSQNKLLRLEALRRVRDILEQGSGVLFKNDPRYFGEVLYLKLTFLQNLTALIKSRRLSSNQIARDMSLEGLWVQLPQKAPQLPLFWNFAFQLVDVAGAPNGPAATTKAPLDTLQMSHFLGRAWFYVLLANERLPFDQVLAGIDQLSADDTLQDQETLFEQPLFDSQNIFQEESLPLVDAQWQPFWQRALQLGLNLVRLSEASVASELDEKQLQDLNQLRADLFQALFQPRPGHLEASLQSPSDGAADTDKPIREILGAILEKWSRAEQPERSLEDLPGSDAESDQGPPSPREGLDVIETVILTNTETHIPVEEGGSPLSQDMEKTVVGLPFETSSAQPKAPSSKPQPELEKTVLITKDQGQPPPDQDAEKTVIVKQPQAPDSGDDLEETVLIAPGSRQQPATDKQPSGPAAPAPQPGVDDLQETMIQGSQPPKKQTSASARTSKDKDLDEQDLEATVIIDPAKSKQRKS